MDENERLWNESIKKAVIGFKEKELGRRISLEEKEVISEYFDKYNPDDNFDFAKELINISIQNTGKIIRNYVAKVEENYLKKGINTGELVRKHLEEREAYKVAQAEEKRKGIQLSELLKICMNEYVVHIWDTKTNGLVNTIVELEEIKKYLTKQQPRILPSSKVVR